MCKYPKMMSGCLNKFIMLFIIGLVSINVNSNANNITYYSSVKSTVNNKKIKIDKESRYIRRHFKDTYHGIIEFSLRSSPSSIKNQQFEFDRQCMAFRAIEKLWNVSKEGGKERSAIETGLLRWNWLKGDPVLNNARPIDWYMVYMECIYKKK